MRTPYFLLPLALLLGCSSPESSDVRVDAWQRIPNAYATAFHAYQAGDARLLVVFGAAGDTVGVYRIGEAPGIAVPVRTVDLPMPQRAVILSSTHAPYMAHLGLADRIVGITGAAWMRDSTVLAALAAGKVVDVAGGQGPDPERLLAARPDVVLTYPFGEGDGGEAFRSAAPVVQVCEYLEPHPLGRAEWLRFFGMVWRCEGRADSAYALIAERYAAMRATVPAGEGRTVFYGSTWQGQWYVPAGNSYMGRLFADAGARYLFADREAAGNITLDTEQAIAIGHAADRWGTMVDQRATVAAADLSGGDARVAGAKAFRTGGLFVANSATADLFGQALLEPDRLLSDLLYVLADDREPGYRPHYFVPVAQ